MRIRPALLPLLAVVAVLAVATSCKKAEPVTTPTPPPVEQPAPPPAPPEPKVEVTEPFKPEPPVTREVVPSIDEINKSGVLKTVYFGYDSSEIDDDARATLQSNADWLKKQHEVRRRDRRPLRRARHDRVQHRPRATAAATPCASTSRASA